MPLKIIQGIQCFLISLIGMKLKIEAASRLYYLKAKHSGKHTWEIYHQKIIVGLY